VVDSRRPGVTNWLGLKGGRLLIIVASFDSEVHEISNAELILFYLRSRAQWADMSLTIISGEGPHWDLNMLLKTN
jgi:hypothetical protein